MYEMHYVWLQNSRYAPTPHIHYCENMPMKYTQIFKFVKMKLQFKIVDSVLIVALNIDCGYTVLTSTHNLCFGANISKK